VLFNHKGNFTKVRASRQIASAGTKRKATMF